MKGVFVTAINCMDGRTQIPVIEWLREKYSAEYVDMITEPGPIKILSENKDKALIDSIKKRLEISVRKHNSKLVAIVGHYDCAGNPVEKDTQIEQIAKSIEVVKSWKFDIQIIGLWVNEKWEVYKI
ncbi:MAG: hypothetical protein H5T34_02225 [Candidatus Methanomethyliales bacterium]|nr:hypothetical protein [Candidatus Methanomethylicales archaeon]